MQHYMVYSNGKGTEVRATDPRDAIKVALNKKNITIVSVKTKEGANFATELVGAKRKVVNYYKVSEIGKERSISDTEIIAKATKLLADNEDNFTSNEKMDNEYASGVHDGIIDLLLKLGIDIGEDYYND